MNTTNPSYYTVTPAPVRYNPNISTLAIVLYGELTALSNSEGYSWASNKYFARLYRVHKRTISREISSLEKEGLIKVFVMKTDSGFDRKIYIADIPNVSTVTNVVDEPQKDEDKKKPSKKDSDSLKNAGVEVLAHWNSKQSLPQHRDNYLERGVSGKATYLTLLKHLLQDYTIAEIKNTVDVYDEITTNPEYWWSHKWTLCDFLKRGYDRFKDEDIAKANFYKNGKKKDTYKPDYSEGF